MTFKTKKDCHLWCDISNDLTFRLEIVVARYTRKTRVSRDVRLRMLGKTLYQLHKEFSKGLRAAMDDMRKRDNEFKVVNVSED